ncbi:MAG: geranylgeranyl reductase family protein [Acidimicrobiaceae bacterium]|nr:geranylgeranyl reductase family protein [Acidimicrobiaceae bacterium]MDE0606747.1 geranylgeranyl reductase family protein [Acidimicrobiaceae bacterium]
MRAETVVVGGGPAGAAAAIVLARAGRDVLVVDKAVFPRDKCCGDGLTALALREFEFLGLDPGEIASWNVVRDVAVRSPSGTERCYPLPEGPGYHAAVVPRMDLDAAVLELARAAGARVEPGCTVAGAEVAGDAIDVLTDKTIGHRIRASNLIAADGMWSPVRKSLGLGVDQYLGEWHAFRQYYRNVTGQAERRLIVWFEPDLLPGYAWSFPLGNGRVNVGFGIRRGGRHTVGDMKQLWLDLLARPHIQQALGAEAVAEAPHKAWPIPARIGRVPLVGPRTMFVGDAAAATDPMTGEGIGQALLTGRLAAESVLAHDDPTAHYAKAVRQELAADDRMSRALIPLLARPWVTRGVLRLTGSTPWTKRNFARWMFEDYPRALLATPRRWKRKMFTGPGAYQRRLRSTP